jgi:hypothetical protein
LHTFKSTVYGEGFIKDELCSLIKVLVEPLLWETVEKVIAIRSLEEQVSRLKSEIERLRKDVNNAKK